MRAIVCSLPIPGRRAGLAAGAWPPAEEIANTTPRPGTGNWTWSPVSRDASDAEQLLRFRKRIDRGLVIARGVFGLAGGTKFHDARQIRFAQACGLKRSVDGGHVGRTLKGKYRCRKEC